MTDAPKKPPAPPKKKRPLTPAPTCRNEAPCGPEGAQGVGSGACGWGGCLSYLGHATSTAGELRHPGDTPEWYITFDVAGVRGEPLRFTGTGSSPHWRGTFSADRTTWRMECRYGFVLTGTARFEGGRYELVGDSVVIPDDLKLPGERM